jgi:hypothetical protein
MMPISGITASAEITQRQWDQVAQSTLKQKDISGNFDVPMLSLLISIATVTAAPGQGTSKPAVPYKLFKEYTPQDIFNGNGWDYQAKPDPTRGYLI